MYRTGHYGAALLTFSPVAALLGLAGHATLAALGVVGVLVLAPVPDYDLRVPLVSHRGATHTLAFALLVALAFGGATLAVARGAVGTERALALAGYGFLVGLLGILSHLLADALTPAGIRPLWPLSGREYSFELVRADNTLANYGLLALGVFVTVALAAVIGP